MRASLSLMPAPVEYQPTITSFGFTRKCSSSMVLWYSMSSATCGVGEYIFTPEGQKNTAPPRLAAQSNAGTKSGVRWRPRLARDLWRLGSEKCICREAHPLPAGVIVWNRIGVFDLHAALHDAAVLLQILGVLS